MYYSDKFLLTENFPFLVQFDFYYENIRASLEYLCLHAMWLAAL